MSPTKWVTIEEFDLYQLGHTIDKMISFLQKLRTKYKINVPIEHDERNDYGHLVFINGKTKKITSTFSKFDFEFDQRHDYEGDFICRFVVRGLRRLTEEELQKIKEKEEENKKQELKQYLELKKKYECERVG